MPRTTGAKNKPKSDEQLIKELESRGYGVSKGEAPHEENTVKPRHTRTDVVIEKPVIPAETTSKKAAETEEVYRCGNKLCNKVLDQMYSVCPHCGVNLTW